MGDDKNKGDFGVKEKPEFKKSKAGYKFDFNSGEWRIDGSTVISWNSLRNIDGITKSGFKKALCRYAEEYSAKYTRNIFNYMTMYLNSTGEMTVNLIGLENYRASLDKKNEYKLGSIKKFLTVWFERGFEGIEEDAISYLNGLKLRGNDKGKAVRRACPYEGALTMNELGALIDCKFSKSTGKR